MTGLREQQLAFTGYLRDPEHQPIPQGLDERRISIYRGLVFNNLCGLLDKFFPVLKQVITADQWNTMVRDFFISYQSQTPYFPQIAEEFASYLASGQLTEGLPAFTAELAHYEAQELALFTLDESPPEAPLDEVRLPDLPLALSPLALPLAYHYPVHQISDAFVPDSASDQPHCFLMLRDQSEAVRFFELAPLAYQLLHSMAAAPGLVPRQWLEAAAKPLGSEAAKTNFITQGIALLRSLNQNRIFIEVN